LTTNPTHHKRTRILGRWLYLHHKWGLALLVPLGLFLHSHALSVRSGEFMMMVGALSILFGTLLRVVCYTFLGTMDPVHGVHGSQLVTGGPFAVTRNPVYLAEAAIALGIAMMSRMTWLVLSTLAVGIVAAAMVIGWEESILHERHGRAWEEYAHAVPRWFSLSRLIHPESYIKTRGVVKLGVALQAESLTLLIGLLSILAFFLKADLERLF
jgi:protein-S-isoprenylcysteine O-methyltransferase Ste14